MAVTLYVDTDAVAPIHPIYSSWVDVESSLPATLVDDYIVIQEGAADDQGSIEFSGVDLNGFTITFKQKESESSNGVYDANSWRGRSNTPYMLRPAYDVIFEGLQLNSYATGASDEVCRAYANGVTITFKKCLLWFDVLQGDQQDIVYNNSKDMTVNLENCVAWNVSRCIVDLYGGSGSAVNINSCTFFNIDNNSNYRHGLVGSSDVSDLNVVSIFNTLAHFSPAASAYACFAYRMQTVTIVDSITSEDRETQDCTNVTLSNVLINHSFTEDDTKTSDGDWVILKDVSTPPYNLGIADNAYNEAQDAHSDGSGAGLTMPATDIAGNIRSAPYCIGAFEYVSGGSILLTLSNTLHAHNADNLTLTQHHNLTASAATHAHLVDNLSLLQQHVLSLSDSQHGHTVDNLTLIQQQLLLILDAAHAHSADQLSLSQFHNLTVDGTDHAHAADSLTLIQNHLLGVNDSLHIHTADNITLLLGELLLAIQSATHNHTTDSLTLQQIHQLSIAAALHAHTADNINLDLSLMLAIADAVHGHTADSITLTQNHILSADDALHTMLADNLALLQDHNITIADALHGHSADNITLFINGLGLGIISDTTVIHLTPQRGKLILTVERSAKHV